LKNPVLIAQTIRPMILKNHKKFVEALPMKQVIDYYNNMVNLENQGAPIDWRKVADAMGATLKAQPQPTASSDASPIDGPTKTAT
jgi:hypothetical protein